MEDPLEEAIRWYAEEITGGAGILPPRAVDGRPRVRVSGACRARLTYPHQQPMH